MLTRRWVALGVRVHARMFCWSMYSRKEQASKQVSKDCWYIPRQYWVLGRRS